MTTKLYSPKPSDYLWLLALALLVRGLAAWPQQQPNYMDAAYYTVNAATLAQGRGFVEDFVWNYLSGSDGELPRPGNLYWMPLTSLAAAAGMLLGGVNYRAAQLSMVVLSALVAPVAFYVGVSLGGRRRHGWLAGLLAIFSGFYFPYWTAVDTFAPFAVAGALALIFAHRGLGEPTAHSSPFALRPSPLFLAGLFAGLAHLTRADGALVLLAILLFFGWKIIHHSPFVIRHSLLFVLPAAGYLLVMAPWFARNWMVSGVLLPAAGTQTIWLGSYDDLFSAGKSLTPAAFLAQGWGAILRGRWWALTVNLQTVVAVWGMIFLTPLAIIGGWVRRRHGLVQLASLYGLLLFAALTLVFAFPGARGGLFHSGAALLPFVTAAAVVGLDTAVEWAAARRRGWNARSAKGFFGVGLVLLAVLLSLFLYQRRVLAGSGWNSADAQYPALAAWVAAQSPGAVVMIGNPPAYRYHGGGPSVVVPNNDLPTTLAVARQYGVTYLVLDANRPQPLAAVFDRPESAVGVSLVNRLGGLLVFELVE